VESKEQLFKIAEGVKKGGGSYSQRRRYKPRTSVHSSRDWELR